MYWTIDFLSNSHKRLLICVVALYCPESAAVLPINIEYNKFDS